MFPLSNVLDRANSLHVCINVCYPDVARTIGNIALSWWKTKVNSTDHFCYWFLAFHEKKWNLLKRTFLQHTFCINHRKYLKNKTAAQTWKLQLKLKAFIFRVTRFDTTVWWFSLRSFFCTILVNKCINIITGRRRSLGQGNIFRSVCKSFCLQVGPAWWGGSGFLF